MLRQEDFLKSHLVTTAWRFAKEYGGHLPAHMIMCCLANRVRLGWGTWAEILDRIPNFAAENDMPPVSYPDIWEPAFIKLLHAVDGVYDGSTKDLSNGALYWADLRRVERTWFKDKIMSQPDQHPRVADCNSLTFFR